MNNAELLVIGDENAVFGFALLGITGKIAHTVDEAHQALEAALADKAITIVFLTDAWATALREEVDHHNATATTPLLVQIPSSQPNPARSSLRDLLQGALGIRLEG